MREDEEEEEEDNKVDGSAKLRPQFVQKAADRRIEDLQRQHESLADADADADAVAAIDGNDMFTLLD